MTKEQFLHLASKDYDQWSTSQEGKSDPYEYERSFDHMMNSLAERLFQMSVGEVPTDHRKKNDSHAVRAN